MPAAKQGTAGGGRQAGRQAGGQETGGGPRGSVTAEDEKNPVPRRLGAAEGGGRFKDGEI